MKTLLLLSNSTNHGSRYLDHAMAAVRAHLGDARRLVFVPFAARDHDSYTSLVRERFAREQIEVSGATPDAAGVRMVEGAAAVFVGGGNTFRLLDALQTSGIVDPLRAAVLGGMPYLGSSAGSVIASPTLQTTNDMPIVEPRSFQALGLVPFQINAHYFDADPSSRHMGETREERLIEYLEENEGPVVGLREGAWIRVQGDRALLEGGPGARVFRRGGAPFEAPDGSRLDLLLGP